MKDEVMKKKETTDKIADFLYDRGWHLVMINHEDTLEEMKRLRYEAELRKLGLKK